MSTLYIRYPGAVISSGSFPLLAPNGTAAAPSYSFTNATGTGLYLAGTNILGFATAGTAAGSISATQAWSIGATNATVTHQIYGRMAIQSGSAVYGLLLGGDFGAGTLTNNTTKQGQLAVPNYANGSPGALAIMMQNGAASNDLYIGGGAAGATTANTINFYTGAAISTTTGTSAGSINASQKWSIGSSTSTQTHNITGSGLNFFAGTAVGSVFSMRGGLVSGLGLQCSTQYYYFDGTNSRNIAEVDVYNTNATATSSGGQYKIATVNTAGSGVFGFAMDENQALTFGATTPATGVFHTMNVDSVTNNKGLTFAEKTATSTTIISRGDVNTGGIKISGGGSGANGGFIQLLGGSNATPNQVQIGNGTGVVGLTVAASGAAAITGTTTNDSAAAGIVGEYIESVISTYTNVPGATTVWGNMTSISLTAGDWDVTGVANWIANGATITTGIDLHEAAISVNSGATTTDQVQGSNQFNVLVPSASTDRFITIPNYRISIASTTTVYFKLLSTYSVATPQYKCRLSARRMR